MFTLQQPTILANHITHKSGKVKTVCVTACLTALGVPVDGFTVTGTMKKANYLSILNRHGYSTRSRLSYMPKARTIGACRKAIKALCEDKYYLIIVNGPSYCHAILLDNQGSTVIDTAPRKADKRKIYSIHAISK